LLAEADPLAAPGIEALERNGVVLVLDQITDPHNVGAILRTRRGVRVKAHRHHRAAFAGGHRRAGEIRVRRARTRAD
jgi:hypothetical protein